MGTFFMQETKTPKFFGRRKGRVIRKTKSTLLEKFLPSIRIDDKTKFDKNQHAWKYNDIYMKRDYYHYENKQWAYKGIKPRIIAEEYIQDDQYDSLSDYKLYCFNGVARGVYVTINRFTNLSVSMYDMDWNLMPFEHIHPNQGEKIEKPKNLELMRELAEKVARFIDNPFVRVDFYETNGKVYFGEITFYPEGGMCYFKPEKWDYIMGSWMKLPVDK